MKVRFALILVCTLLGQTASRANFVSYSQWEAREGEWRRAYIEGAVDSLVSYATDDHGRMASIHYSNCLRRAAMTGTQLSEDLRSYVSTRPNLQSGTVQGALIGYLVALCGSPASQ